MKEKVYCGECTYSLKSYMSYYLCKKTVTKNYYGTNTYKYCKEKNESLDCADFKIKEKKKEMVEVI